VDGIHNDRKLISQLNIVPREDTRTSSCQWYPEICEHIRYEKKTLCAPIQQHMFVPPWGMHKGMRRQGGPYFVLSALEKCSKALYKSGMDFRVLMYFATSPFRIFTTPAAPNTSTHYTTGSKVRY
jgi:hypothetical protein